MMRRGLEVEEMSLSDDVSREFAHVQAGQTKIEKHLEQQDRHMSDHFKKFNEHVIADNNWAALLKAHLEDHATAQKHRWVMVSGIILTAASSLGILAVEVLKHFILKG